MELTLQQLKDKFWGLQYLTNA